MPVASYTSPPDLSFAIRLVSWSTMLEYKTHQVDPHLLQPYLVRFMIVWSIAALVHSAHGPTARR